MDFSEALNTYFSDALPGDELTRRASKLLEDEGFEPARTLLATSTCPDELNRLVTNFGEHWGAAFHMGGLAGIPFTGQSGFDAFASHIPDDGAAFLVYASHVGITDEGQLGRIVRPQQKDPTFACGSAVGAFIHLEEAGSPDAFETQQAHVTRLVKRRLPEIKDSAQPMAVLPAVIFDEINREIWRLIPEDLDRKLALLGGIQINAPEGEDDYFLVKEFSVLRPAEGSRRSLQARL